MELGALVCTPKKPACAKCPVSKYCQANLRGKSVPIDIEDSAAGTYVTV
jgi:adenine-specific DNA glycosylase